MDMWVAPRISWPPGPEIGGFEGKNYKFCLCGPWRPLAPPGSRRTHPWRPWTPPGRPRLARRSRAPPHGPRVDGLRRSSMGCAAHRMVPRRWAPGRRPACTAGPCDGRRIPSTRGPCGGALVLRASRGRPGGAQGRQGCVRRDPGAPGGATGRTDKICLFFCSKPPISGPGGHEIRGATHVRLSDSS